VPQLVDLGHEVVATTTSSARSSSAGHLSAFRGQSSIKHRVRFACQWEFFVTRAAGLRLGRVTGITRYVSSDASWTSAETSADTLLRRLGAPTLAHPGGSLYEHLWRVHALLKEWDAPRPIRLAGLCHAVYGTAGFDRELLSPTARTPLVDAIGRRAEALVHLYASCDRADFYPRLEHERPPRFRDRFTGRERGLPEATLRALVEITAANELDVLHHDDRFRASHGDALLGLFTASADLLSPHPVSTISC
jgi:hypothetical protein